MSSCRRTTYRRLRLLAASFLGVALLSPLAAHADETPPVIPDLGRKLTVTVDVEPYGYRQARGTVTSQPAGVACALPETAPAKSATCSAYFPTNSTVVLTATPGDAVHCVGGICSVMFGGPSVFAGWGGACLSAGTNPTCTVSLDEAKAATAKFDLPKASVGVTVTGQKKSTLALQAILVTSVATGTVTATDNFGFNSAQVLDCRYIADAGAVSARQVGTCRTRVYAAPYGPQHITFVAQPTKVMTCGFVTCTASSITSSFLGWGGPCAFAGTESFCTVPLDQAKDVTAKFGLPLPVSVPS